MKSCYILKEIKTEAEFYDMADIWYQRSHKLREIWQDETQTAKRKVKSYFLWLKMYNRIQNLLPTAIRISQPNPPIKYKQGSKN